MGNAFEIVLSCLLVIVLMDMDDVFLTDYILRNFEIFYMEGL